MATRPREVMESRSPVGYWVRRWRVENGWTQAELARRAKIQPSRISALERSSDPRWEMVLRLAKAFGVEPDTLFRSPGRALDAVLKVGGFEPPEPDRPLEGVGADLAAQVGAWRQVPPPPPEYWVATTTPQFNNNVTDITTDDPVNGDPTPTED